MVIPSCGADASEQAHGRRSGRCERGAATGGTEGANRRRAAAGSAARPGHDAVSRGSIGHRFRRPIRAIDASELVSSRAIRAHWLVGGWWQI